METRDLLNVRVHHDHYGDGTVTSQSGEWLLVLFDAYTFAHSVHADDVTPINATKD